MNNFDTLLANINRNYIHPPPEIEEECKRIGEFNAILIDRATNHLWKNFIRLEKLEYVNLAQRGSSCRPKQGTLLNRNNTQILVQIQTKKEYKKKDIDNSKKSKQINYKTIKLNQAKPKEEGIKRKNLIEDNNYIKNPNHEKFTNGDENQYISNRKFTQELRKIA
ncbi:hypothetical protein Glove_310g6 [Diversispora epigaea]|uniref:Uncharacterized protein n=1 Tax=Diversispora epigaea TaxID=1348612 RepID=A0A397HSB1_9GLOM|nr:hypothetical protein Glove_310g6 [Diversispora epigaea]